MSLFAWFGKTGLFLFWSYYGFVRHGINVNELRSSGVSPCHLHLFHDRTILIKDQKIIKYFGQTAIFSVTVQYNTGYPPDW